MGLDDVVDTLERVEQLLADGQTGPTQDSLSWQRASDDANIQLGKACAMLGTCRQLREVRTTTSASSNYRLMQSNGRSSSIWSR